MDSVHSIWVEVKYRTSSFVLCTVSRSPGTPVAFWDNFNLSLEKAFDSNPNVIVVGD